jgi:uncharacterized OB-fold protein
MITEKVHKPSEIKTWAGEIPVHNLYTTGIAGEKFLRAIKNEGKLLATVCRGCKKDYLPPKIFCPFCLVELQEWKEVPARGLVETFTIARSDIAGMPLDEPLIFAFIRLVQNGGLIHKLGEVEPDKVKIGLKVEAVFKPGPERTGSILDIRYFRPI